MKSAAAENVKSVNSFVIPINVCVHAETGFILTAIVLFNAHGFRISLCLIVFKYVRNVLRPSLLFVFHLRLRILFYLAWSCHHETTRPPRFVLFLRSAIALLYCIYIFNSINAANAVN